MQIKLVRTYGEQIAREFEAVDNKGRRFGSRASLVTFNYVPFDGTEDKWTNDCSTNLRSPVTEPKTRYGFYPHALRAGTSYGASQSTNLFETEAERDAAIAAYFVAAEKRALKNKARAA